MANIDPQVVVEIIGLIGIAVTAGVTPIVVPAIRDRLEERPRRNQQVTGGEVPRSPDSEVKADDRGTDRPQTTGDEAYLIYTVERGDTVGKIARRYNTTVGVVVRINDLPDPDLLVPGDELLIPRGSLRDT
jgi:LysM repeat protein